MPEWRKIFEAEDCDPGGGSILNLVSTNKDDFTLTTTKITDGEIDFTIQAKKAATSPLTLTFSVTKAKATVTQDLVVSK